MITKKQKEVLDFISKYAEKYGYAPSLEEMRVTFKFASVSTPYHYVNKLQKEGYLKKIVEGAKSHGLPPEYVAELQNWAKE